MQILEEKKNKTTQNKTKQKKKKKGNVIHPRIKMFRENFFGKVARFGGHSSNGFEVIQICRNGEPLGSEQGQLTR